MEVIPGDFNGLKRLGLDFFALFLNMAFLWIQKKLGDFWELLNWNQLMT